MLPAVWTLATGPPGKALEIDPWLGLALGLVLVAINGYFVAAEFALVKVRPTQIEPHVERGDLRGRVLQPMITHLDAYLSATQLGITLASLGLGWIGQPAFEWVLRPVIELIPGATEATVQTISLSAAFAVITILHIVLGELAPKSLAIRHPEATALWIALPLYTFYKITYPAIWLLNHAAGFFLSLFGVKPATESEMGHSEEELRLLLSLSGHSLSDEKQEMLDNIFELSDRVARQIMVPRGDVVFLSTERDVNENLELARSSGHTRFPLVRDSLDDVVGLIHIKDLFRLPEAPADLSIVARPIRFVPEGLALDRLMRQMRAEKAHLAAVLDEWGGVSGIVTLENVIEEIVGEIQDEFDAEQPDLVELGNDLFRVAGGMLVIEIEEALAVELSDRDEDTIGGVVLSELGRRPRVGDRISLGPLRFRVAEVEGNRIRVLDLERSKTDDDPP